MDSGLFWGGVKTQESGKRFAPEKARRQNLVVAATSIVGAWSIPKECANVGMNRHTASFNTRSNILHNLTP
jgi:hypothetical protein